MFDRLIGMLFLTVNYFDINQNQSWPILLIFSPIVMFVSLRTQAEMAHTCRGTIPLATAYIEVGDTCHLVLTSGGRSYHLKATSEGECQRWVSALQQAKANSTLMMHHSGKMEILYSVWPIYFDVKLCDQCSHTVLSWCKEIMWLHKMGCPFMQTNQQVFFFFHWFVVSFKLLTEYPKYVLKRNNMVHLRMSKVDKLILAVTWMQAHADPLAWMHILFISSL